MCAPSSAVPCSVFCTSVLHLASIRCTAAAGCVCVCTPSSSRPVTRHSVYQFLGYRMIRLPIVATRPRPHVPYTATHMIPPTLPHSSTSGSTTCMQMSGCSALCRHPFSRVLAKNVYNEYIGDKQHIHMNSTRWLSLTEFVKYLGKEGAVWAAIKQYQLPMSSCSCRFVCAVCFLQV